ncbi:MAG: class I SAM-dependent methyltransferase family protein [Pseudomonadota bacterium]
MGQTLADLQAPLAPWDPKAWYYTAARALLACGATVSEGLSIGRTHGFDSGVMLDYVYRNEACGLGPLGRFVDRLYLDAPGWAGIRNRGRLLQQTIVREILDRPERPVRLADLACGGGRYVLGALAELGSARFDAVLRDYRRENCETARWNAAKAGLLVKVERGDAFDPAALATLGTRDIVVVSGLHEIIVDNDRVRIHFQQIRDVLPVGGTLILTIQPDHPQLEFIARVLRSHTGRPWAMRLRDRDLTRTWLQEAGFGIRSVRMEARGIFGVMIADRVA